MMTSPIGIAISWLLGASHANRFEADATAEMRYRDADTKILRYTILALCMSVKINFERERERETGSDWVEGRQEGAGPWINQFVNINKTTEIIFSHNSCGGEVVGVVAVHGKSQATDEQARATIVSHGFHQASTATTRRAGDGHGHDQANLWVQLLYGHGEAPKLTHYK